MIKLNVSCPLHNLPFEYVVITENNPYCLRCKNCPLEPTGLRISNQVEYMKARMGDDKTKRRQSSKSKSRSKSKGKKGATSAVNLNQDDGDDDEIQICRLIAEEQVKIVQLVMKLLTEDKKKYLEKLEKSIQDHKKLWMQYSQSSSDIIFMNKLCKNQWVGHYLNILNERGWRNMKTILCQIYNRNYLCKKVTNQSQQIIENLKASADINQNTVLRSLEVLLESDKIKKKKDEAKQIEMNKTPQRYSFKGNNKRSKSFGV